jgi:hypothetical protein
MKSSSEPIITPLFTHPYCCFHWTGRPVKR